MREKLSLALGLLMIGGAAYLAFPISDLVFGYPWSGLAATVAGMGALRMLSDAPIFRALNQRSQCRELQREREDEDRRMRRVLKRSGLLK